jgi:hypothetical protein
MYNVAVNKNVSGLEFILPPKDDIVANSAAEKICNALGVVTTVVAGIHMDNASRDEIEGAVKIAGVMVDEMISMHKKPT